MVARREKLEFGIKLTLLDVRCWSQSVADITLTRSETRVQSRTDSTPIFGIFCRAQLRCAPSGQLHEAKMAVTDLIIRDIKVRAVVAPLKRPVRTAVGTIPSAPLVLIDVLTGRGSVGRSYIFAYTAAALAPLARLVSTKEVRGLAYI